MIINTRHPVIPPEVWDVFREKVLAFKPRKTALQVHRNPPTWRIIPGFLSLDHGPLCTTPMNGRLRRGTTRSLGVSVSMLVFQGYGVLSVKLKI